jgi:hypothetical protein
MGRSLVIQLSRRSLQIMLLCLAVNACTADRQIAGRGAVSVYPEAGIRVDSHLRYLGRAKYEAQVKTEEGDRYITHMTESDIYVPKNLQGGPVIKGLDIRTTTIREEDASFVVRDEASTRSLDSGTTTMAGKKYDYATWLIRPSMKGGNSKFLESRGYRMPSCVLVREFKREVDAKTRTKIVYWEEASMSNLSCGRTKTRKKPSSAGKAMLDAFHKRAAASFTITR